MSTSDRDRPLKLAPAPAGTALPAPLECPPKLPAAAAPGAQREIGGPRGPEPTRYGDWEKAGRCIDF